MHKLLSQLALAINTRCLVNYTLSMMTLPAADWQQLGLTEMLPPDSSGFI